MKPNAIIIHEKDNVAVALEDIQQGQPVVIENHEAFETISDISYSHKVLLEDVGSEGDIIKYGEVIGQATDDLNQGEWIHTHNMNVIEES
jgi:predicted RecA/RadA family phage recombinase